MKRAWIPRYTMSNRIVSVFIHDDQLISGTLFYILFAPLFLGFCVYVVLLKSSVIPIVNLKKDSISFHYIVGTGIQARCLKKTYRICCMNSFLALQMQDPTITWNSLFQ